MKASKNTCTCKPKVISFSVVLSPSSNIQLFHVPNLIASIKYDMKRSTFESKLSATYLICVDL